MAENSQTHPTACPAIALEPDLARRPSAQSASCYDCAHAVNGIHAGTRKHKLICTVFGREALSPCRHYRQTESEHTREVASGSD